MIRRTHLVVVAVLVVAGALLFLFGAALLEASDALKASADGRLATVLRWCVLACFLYLLAVYLSYGVLLLFAGFDSAVRNRQRSSEDFDALEVSRFTIPVSILSTVYNEETVAVASTRTLLEQEYPELEVILVEDGSTDRTFERLDEAFDLERVEIFFRRIIPSEPITGVYRSRSDARLTVVRKVNGGNKADAVNCALNFARYRYVLGVDGDTMYRSDALLLGMRLVMRDPARVIGVTSMIATALRPEEVHAQEPAGALSTGTRSAPSSTSTISAHSSRSGLRGAASASCSAPPAPSTSGAATCSRRWAASRGPSRAKTSR